MANRLYTGLALAAASFFLLTGCGSEPAPPVSVEEAERSTDSVLVAADEAFRTGDFDGFCREFAADIAMCSSDVEAWQDANGPAPSLESVSTSFTPLTTSTPRVRFEGEFVDGSSFASETEVVRDTSREVKLVNPVFWVPRTVQDGTGPSAPQTP
nr:hypothetical protein [Microbacterium hydrocarbonoxydans]